VRKVAVKTAIPMSTVYKIYKYSLVQTLTSAAITSRLFFCNEFQKKIENCKDYLETILFTDFEWPSHSPDLNPCDYFLWGFMKDYIYGPNQVDNVTRLKENIEKYFKELPKSTISNIHCHVTKCINEEGKNFE